MNVDYNDKRFAQVESEKQNELNRYNNTYDNLIKERNEFTQQQQNLVNQWEQTQRDIANQNLQHQTELYNQQKEKAEKDYQREASASYADYLKEADRYGVSREQQVANGLSNSGYSESSKVNMYNTYQNRLASARRSMNDAVLEFDNAIKEAQLSNNATLAQNALEALQKKLDIALEGFNYKDTQTQNKLTWENNINNQYYGRYKDVESQINYENEQQEAIRQYNEQMARQKEQDAIAQQRWEREMELQQQQLEYQKQQDAIENAQRWAQINASNNAYNSSSSATLTDSSNSNTNSKATELAETNKQVIYNPSNDNRSQIVKINPKYSIPSYLSNNKWLMSTFFNSTIKKNGIQKGALETKISTGIRAKLITENDANVILDLFGNP